MYKINKTDFLISLYILCIALSELMGAKTFPIVTIWGFHLNASVAIFVIPVIFTINDVIAEVYGRERAKSLVAGGFITIGLIVLFSFLATMLPPSARFAASENAYDEVFYKTIRISIASLIAFGVSDLLDVYIFTGLKKRFGDGSLWFRTNMSNFVSEFVDTAVFIYLAFYALDQAFLTNLNFLFGLILPYWLLKCVMSVIETPFAYLGVRWLRDEAAVGMAVADES